jgi:hypothetical protein
MSSWKFHAAEVIKTNFHIILANAMLSLDHNGIEVEKYQQKEWTLFRTMKSYSRHNSRPIWNYGNQVYTKL